MALNELKMFQLIVYFSLHKYSVPPQMHLKSMHTQCVLHTAEFIELLRMFRVEVMHVRRESNIFVILFNQPISNRMIIELNLRIP